MITKFHLNDLRYKMAGCVTEVHKHPGPELRERAFQASMNKEFSLRSTNCTRQLPVPINYKGLAIDDDYRLDFLAEDQIVVELKAMEGLVPVNEAQLLTYMQPLQKPKGILLHLPSINIVIAGSKPMVNEFFASLPE